MREESISLQPPANPALPLSELEVVNQYSSLA